MKILVAFYIPAVILGMNSAAANDTSCAPITARITEPGTYCLLTDTVRDDGISILAENVIVDLRGFCLRGNGTPSSRSTAITITGRRATIRGGCISGYFIGIRVLPEASNALITNMLIEHNTFRAALIEAPSTIVEGNVIVGVSGTTVYEDASTMGLDLRSPDCLVRANLIKDVLPVGIGDAVGISIASPGCKVTDNVVANSRRPEWGRTYGIAISSNAVLDRNVFVGQTYGIASISDPPANNKVVDEVCNTASEACPDDISSALKAMNETIPQTIFIVGRAYHKSKNYPRAAIYYLAAAQRGISEGRRIVERHLNAGYITKTDFESAQQESARLFH